MASQIQKGYLLLADISGYTAFMEHSELDHAPLVLNHIITFLLDQLTPTMQLAEIEGDAVFVYSGEENISRGELLLELVEATYMNFRDRKMTMMHNITCPCKACQSVSTLDLKFVIHYGEYALQKVAGKIKPIGSCVNLAHRLLKNTVTTETGWHGYALFSASCLEHTEISPEDVHSGSETYDHFGEVNTFCINLDGRYHEYLKYRHIQVKPEQADVALHYDFTSPPPVIWDWLNDPVKRNKWAGLSNWVARDRPFGRTGPEAMNHCTASNMLEHILDWRPFHYFTVCYKKGIIDFTLTNVLSPTEEGTHLDWNMRLNGSMPRWMLRMISKLIVHIVLRMKKSFKKIEGLSQKKSTRYTNFQSVK